MKWMNLSIHQSGHSVLICKHTVIQDETAKLLVPTLTHYRWRERKNRKKEIEKNKCDSSRLRLMPIPLKVLTKLCHLLAISSILLQYVKIILPLPGTLDPTQTIKLSKHIDVTRNAIKQLDCKDHFLLHLYSCRLKAVFSIELLYSCFPLIALAIFNK